MKVCKGFENIFRKKIYFSDKNTQITKGDFVQFGFCENYIAKNGESCYNYLIRQGSFCERVRAWCNSFFGVRGSPVLASSRACAVRSHSVVI